jgi:hypothetical protein
MHPMLRAQDDDPPIITVDLFAKYFPSWTSATAVAPKDSIRESRRHSREEKPAGEAYWSPLGIYKENIIWI